MSTHLKKITARAKQIRLSKPTMKWTNAIKLASQELGYGNGAVGKKPGRKSSTVIYAKPTKTKTGKTRLKVYARAKTKPKAKPGNELPPAMSKPRKPRPAPRKPTQTYVTPSGKVYTKTKQGRKRILGVNGIKYEQGRPMMSLSGYPMRNERIFVGKTAMVCKKIRDMKAKKPKNIGELEKIYSVPEVQVKLIGRDKVKGTQIITNSETGARLIRNYMDMYSPTIRSTKEMFGLLLLNYQNQVLGVYADSVGGQTATVTDVQYGLVVAIKLSAKAVIMFHNHPSGTMKPSNADRDLTYNYKKAFAQIECQVIDHMIISGVDNSYYSFADNGEL